MVLPRHQLQRKLQKKAYDYSRKSIDDFKLIIVNPSLKLTDQQNSSVMNSFGSSSQDQCIETNTKIILTRVLKRWNENTSSAHPSTCSLTPSEDLAPKTYSIEFKQCS